VVIDLFCELNVTQLFPSCLLTVSFITGAWPAVVVDSGFQQSFHSSSEVNHNLHCELCAR